MVSTRTERFLDRLFRCRVIVNCDHVPYLTRWFIFRKPWLGIFIHKFHRSDEDRALHDHPWNFISIILWRGYYEITEEVKEWLDDGGPALPSEWSGNIKRRKWPGMILYRPATWRHRVELIREPPKGTHHSYFPGLGIPIEKFYRELPAWSLIIRFKKFRVWGFWPEGKFVDNVSWWNQNCED